MPTVQNMKLRLSKSCKPSYTITRSAFSTKYNKDAIHRTYHINATVRRTFPSIAMTRINPRPKGPPEQPSLF